MQESVVILEIRVDCAIVFVAFPLPRSAKIFDRAAADFSCPAREFPVGKTRSQPPIAVTIVKYEKSTREKFVEELEVPVPLDDLLIRSVGQVGICCPAHEILLEPGRVRDPLFDLKRNVFVVMLPVDGLNSLPGNELPERRGRASVEADEENLDFGLAPLRQPVPEEVGSVAVTEGVAEILEHHFHLTKDRRCSAQRATI